MWSFIYRSEFYTHDHTNHYCELENSLLNCLHSIQVDIWNSFWDINKDMTKSCPLWKSGKTSYLGIEQKLDRPLIHTHHIYMYEHIFLWMCRAQMIRICDIEIKIWGCTPFSGAFSKWLPWKQNAEKPKIEMSVSQHLIIGDIQNLPLDICFWGWQTRQH